MKKRKKANGKRSPLPWEHPKPRSEDPKALSLVKKLMESPTYRLAEEAQEYMWSASR